MNTTATKPVCPRAPEQSTFVGRPRRPVWTISIAAVFLASCFAVAARAGQPVPERLPGLWRITTISAATGMTSMETCIRAGDSIATPADGRRCAAPDVEVHSDQTIVNVACETKLGMEMTSTLYTGDFKTWYRGIVKITYDPPFGGVGNLGVTIDAKRLGEDCPKDNAAN